MELEMKQKEHEYQMKAALKSQELNEQMQAQDLITTKNRNFV